jgi:hypothetical protein
MKTGKTLARTALVVCAAGTLVGANTRLTADCSLTSMGIVPLSDLAGEYQGFPGGLYPNGTSIRPLAHEAVGVGIAQNRIQPLNAEGLPDAAGGRIVRISIGTSNTLQEFSAFSNLVRNDSAKSRHLTVIDNAGNASRRTLAIPVGSGGPDPETPGPPRNLRIVP